MRSDQLRALTIASLCGAMVVGCGKSAPRPVPRREAQVINEINAFCRHLDSLPASRRHERDSRATLARSAALQTALSAAAASQPIGRDLNAAHAARRALEREEAKRSEAGLTEPQPDLRFERLQLRIYRDEHALGITCPLVNAEAHRIARLLSAST